MRRAWFKAETDCGYGLGFWRLAVSFLRFTERVIGLPARSRSHPEIQQKLAAAKINIEYACCATPPDAKKGLLILRVRDAKQALKALNSLDIETLQRGA